MTNVREHVSWVNTDKAGGTEKAKALVAASAERVKHQQPLEPMHVKVNPATLVIGGGIAGLQATLELADAGYHVYLVEREPSIGGHMAQFDKTFPTLDCSACILTPKMSEVGQHENVTMLTYSELEEVSGSVGNFKVKIRKKARMVDEAKCTGCGICIEKCPRKVVDDVFEVGMGYAEGDLHALPAGRAADARDRHGQLHVVHPRQVPGLREGLPHQRRRLRRSRTRSSSSRWATSSWPRAGSRSIASGFRSTATGGWPTSTRTWSSSGSATPPGPTNGKIVLRDGKTEPKSVAIIHCVGSRDVDDQHLLLERLLHGGDEVRPPRAGKDQGRGLLVLHRHADAEKDYEEFYQRLLEEGMHFVRGKVAEVTDAARQPDEAGRADRPSGRHADGQATADPGRHGHPDGRAGAAGRRQGNGPEVRHFVQHGRLVHRAASQARPGGHDDRRRVRGRRLPGTEGHSRLGGPGRRGGRPRAGHDHQGPGDDRADRGLDQRRGVLRLPHLQQRCAPTTPSSSTRRRTSAA